MSDNSFAALSLAEPLQRALRERNYTVPSPIQARAIPILMAGRDLLACAQTGTGKTAAFALPILHDLHSRPAPLVRGRTRALILTPTRELAVQVAASFETYGKHIRFKLALVYGGVSAGPQVRAMDRGVDVLVATPGRLLDLFEQGRIDFKGVETFVLDEADRMLDMGFLPDIRRIMNELPARRRTSLFSATMPQEIAALSSRLLQNPEEIRIVPEATAAERIDQRVLFVDNARKKDLLVFLLEAAVQAGGVSRTLVFSKTKHGANRLAGQLLKTGLNADAIHGNKSQAARQKALDRFRMGKTGILVATDVAARGIDVTAISLVVNYDLPMEADAYIHRIGRTARAGASGRAVSFCSGEQTGALRDIQKRIRKEIPVESDHPYHDAVAMASMTDRRLHRRSGFGESKPRYNARGRFKRRGGFKVRG